MCKARRTAASQLKSGSSSVVQLTVHQDRKLSEDLTTREHMERLPILISGAGCEQLLAVQKLLFGTGEAQATAMVNAIKLHCQHHCLETHSSYYEYISN